VGDETHRIDPIGQLGEELGSELTRLLLPALRGAELAVFAHADERGPLSDGGELTVGRVEQEAALGVELDVAGAGIDPPEVLPLLRGGAGGDGEAVQVRLPGGPGPDHEPLLRADRDHGARCQVRPELGGHGHPPLGVDGVVKLAEEHVRSPGAGARPEPDRVRDLAVTFTTSHHFSPPEWPKTTPAGPMRQSERMYARQSGPMPLPRPGGPGTPEAPSSGKPVGRPRGVRRLRKVRTPQSRALDNVQ